MNSSETHPVQFRVEYPEGTRNRGSVLVRLLLAIPILIVASLLSGHSEPSQFDTLWNWDLAHGSNAATGAAGVGAGLAIATALMILFRQKYPRWWFNWNLELARFSTRVGAYLLLLRDEYPSTDEQQAVTLDIAYPDVPAELNRVLPLFKWLLAIPHYIVLSVLGVVVVPVSILGWIVILVTGSQPRWIFTLLEGLMRWWLRVGAYAFLLTTDRYPPFRLD